MADVKVQVGDRVTFEAAGTRKAGHGVVTRFIGRDLTEVIDADTGQFIPHLNIDLTRQTPTFEVYRRIEHVWTVQAETAEEAAAVIYKVGPDDSNDLEQSVVVIDTRYDAEAGDYRVPRRVSYKKIQL